MAEKPLRMAVYLRISKDPDGTSTATTRQLTDCKRFAKLKDWRIAEVFEDTDTSAYRQVARPRYEALLHALAEGEVDGVLVWKLDRLVRRTAEFERFWSICEKAGGRLASVNDTIDSSTPTGMVVVKILMAFAEMEAAQMSLRMRRAELERAEAGRPKLSGYRAYGLSRDWTTLIEDEAAIIKESAARVLAGESLRSICLDLNERGVPTSGGTRWRPSPLQSILTNPRLWGKRTYHGEIVGDGNWPAILDELTGEQLLRRLHLTRGTQAARKYLLSGILRCGKCGTRMRANASRNGGCYICPPRPEGCNGVQVNRPKVDAFISEMTLAALDSPALRKRLKEAAGGPRINEAKMMGELGDARSRQAELAEMFADGQIGRSEWLAARRGLEERIGKAEAQLSRVTDAGPLTPLVGQANMSELWEQLPTLRRRAVIDALFDRITILPGAQGKRFSAARVAEPIWKI
jgi:DNA invertase Pin-like site-specific DNA recombinase